jgi:hypothetical protein
MIADDALLMLALAELSGPDAEEAGEHVLACGACAERLEQLVALGIGIRDLVRAGKTWIVLSRRLLERMDRDGLVSRTYRVRPGETVPCGVGARDVYALTHLEADLTGVSRVDLVVSDLGMRVDDVPFDRERGEITFVERSDHVRALPTGPIRLVLVAVDDVGERALGEYTLSHTAYVP